MMVLSRFVVFFVVLMMFDVATLGAESFSQRFEKGSSSFGAQLGWGHTVDLPPGRNRTDLGFAFFFPNWQRNLSGITGDSWSRGAWFYHMEAGLAFADREDKFLLGWSPLMAQYKFLNPKRRWAPNILLGAGASMTNWKDIADRELGTEFQFLLNLGVGLEYFKENGTYSINYRLFHVSNAGIKFPNIGLNAHVFSLGISF